MRALAKSGSVATLALGTALVFTLVGCSLNDREPRLRRSVTTSELLGTWRLVTEHGDLSELNFLGVTLKGREIVLAADGQCSVPMVSGLGTGEPEKGDLAPGKAGTAEEGLLRHPVDGCRWTIGSASARTGDAAAINLGITQAGKFRGLSLFIYEQDGALHLWTYRDPTDSNKRLDLRR